MFLQFLGIVLAGCLTTQSAVIFRGFSFIKMASLNIIIVVIVSVTKQGNKVSICDSLNLW